MDCSVGNNYMKKLILLHKNISTTILQLHWPLLFVQINIKINELAISPYIITCLYILPCNMTTLQKQLL